RAFPEAPRRASAGAEPRPQPSSKDGTSRAVLLLALRPCDARSHPLDSVVYWTMVLMSALAKPTRCTDRTRTSSLVPAYGPTRVCRPSPAGKSAGSPQLDPPSGMQCGT